MTIVGYITIIAMLYTYTKPYRFTVAMLMISLIFQATPALRLANGTYIAPYILCEIFLVVRVLLSIKLIRKRFTANKILKSTISMLIIWGFAITILGPILFQGLEVSGKNLDQTFLEGTMRLKFSFKNIAQIGYLILNLITLYCVYTCRDKINDTFLKKTFLICVSLSLIFGYWEFISKTTGKLYFPVEILRNDKTAYTAAAIDSFRMCSLCLESSFFGCFIGSAFWAITLMENVKYKTVILLFTIIAIALSISGSGVVSFIAGFFIYCYLKKFSIKRLLPILFFLLVAFFLLDSYGYLDILLQMINEKSESQSGEVRYYTTMLSFNAFIQSCFLGIGMGSTRSSSFIADSLAGLGIIGTYLLFKVMFLLISPLRKTSEKYFIFTYCLSLFVCQCLSISDFSYSFFWFGLFLAASSAGYRNSNKVSSSKLLYIK